MEALRGADDLIAHRLDCQRANPSESSMPAQASRILTTSARARSCATRTLADTSTRRSISVVSELFLAQNKKVCVTDQDATKGDERGQSPSGAGLYAACGRG